MSDSNKISLWDEVKDLFEHDDGSLPDICVKNLNPREIESIYSWVLSLTEIYGEPTLWSIKDSKDVPVSAYKNPAKDFNAGEVESFHHPLKEFAIGGTTIPMLGIRVGKGAIDFDYRMGKEWGEEQVEALSEFLAQIRDKAPIAKIFQADEGCYEKPNAKFAKAFEQYYQQRKAS